MVDAGSGIVVGEICHIKGKSPNGPRYDKNQSKRERDAYENLLLMCDAHNKVVDHEETRDKYPPQKLLQFKKRHENRFRRKLTDPTWADDLNLGLVNQSHLIAFVNHFRNVKGSVITTHNQSGGQNANQITNNYYLGTSHEPAEPSKERYPPKGRKRSNLKLHGIEYPKLFLENDVFWEAPHGDDMYPYPCAVLRYCNDAIPGQPGQPIKGLRAALQFRSTNGHLYAPIDRGTWVRERYNSIDLAVGSCRMLVIIWRSQPAIKPFAFTPVDHHYSDRAYDRMYFMPLKELPIEVNVSLLAGDGGYLMDQRTFRAEIDPELRLIDLTANATHFNSTTSEPSTPYYLDKQQLKYLAHQLTAVRGQITIEMYRENDQALDLGRQFHRLFENCGWCVDWRAVLSPLPETGLVIKLRTTGPFSRAHSVLIDGLNQIGLAPALATHEGLAENEAVLAIGSRV